MVIALHNNKTTNHTPSENGKNFPWSHSFQMAKSPSFDGSLYTVMWNSSILKKPRHR